MARNYDVEQQLEDGLKLEKISDKQEWYLYKTIKLILKNFAL